MRRRHRFSPDGTARFPWNGFAGEGISLTSSFPRYTVTFPGGSCDLLELAMGLTLLGVMPSPDGSNVAFLTRNVDIPGGFTSEVQISSLVDGGRCPEMTSASYELYPGVGGAAVNNAAFVWKPDSSAILFTTGTAPVGAGTALHRLDATPGATPVAVIGGGFESITPLAWSVANRVLISAVAPGGLASTLATIPAVFNDGSAQVTNADGYSFPWFQVHVISDVDFGTSGPLTGVAPPLVWHRESLGPGLDVTEVPNLELVGRFTR